MGIDPTYRGTFALTLNNSRKELVEPPYCRTQLAQNFVPGAKPAGITEYVATPEGFWSGTAGRFFHDPLTGLLTLRPNFLDQGFWTTDDFEADKLAAADWDFGSGDFVEQFLQQIGATPVSPVVFTAHGNTAGAIDPLTGLTTLSLHGSTGGPPVELLQGAAAADYAYLLQTERVFARNEAFAFQLISHDLAMASTFPSHLVYFGKRYALLIGIGGRMELWRNEFADEAEVGAANEWRMLAALDYSASIDGQAQQSVSVMVLPYSERFIGILVGPGMANTSWVGAFGGEETSPARRYLVPIADEVEFDEATELFKLTAADKITVAGLKTGQFSLGFYKIRYPAVSQTMHLAPEDLGALFPDDTPGWTAWETHNRGSTTFETINVDGTAWDPATDRKVVGEIVMTAGAGLDFESAAGEWIYTPEVHYATLQVPPKIELVDRSLSEVDLTQLWRRLSFVQRASAPGYLDIETVNNESLDTHFRKPSFPVRLELQDDLSGTDYVLFDGLVTRNEANVPVERPQLALTANDGWQTLRENTFWDSPVFDAQEGYTALRWYLNGCGFDDSRIYVQDAALTPLLPEPVRPQDYTYRSQGETGEEACYRILDAGLELTLDERHAETGWTAIDGVTALTETDMVWVIGIRPVFVDEESTPTVAKFWLTKPAGETWSDEATRYLASGGDLRGYEANWSTRGPLYNVLHVDAPDASGKDAVRHSTALIVNEASRSDAASRDYIGRTIRGYANPATHGAKTKQEIMALARRLEEEDMHTEEIVTVFGEWRPWVRPDAFVEVYSLDFLTGFMKKRGIYRVMELAADVNISILPLVTGVYTLHWEADGEEYTDPNEVV